MFDGVIITDLVDAGVMANDRPKQRSLRQNEIYPVTLSHFFDSVLVDHDVFVDFRKGLWCVN